ncbi:hypothetical protein LSTR_LSTR015942 [Laodelphax striatellus]|uniref:Uncharacterized protein n=1 Tax=Laodelphax striatellus TaxID=195883 RepID=A0A482X7B3_LAOST|nr:hypothetical protein LSTR_LSTR015942 [Laodelphax striatellus]
MEILLKFTTNLRGWRPGNTAVFTAALANAANCAGVDCRRHTLHIVCASVVATLGRRRQSRQSRKGARQRSAH